MKLELTLLVLFALPAFTQETAHPLDAIDVSVHNSVNPVSNYFPETPNAPQSARTNSFTPLRPVYKTQPSIWFRPLQYSAPPLASPANATRQPPLTLPPVTKSPSSAPVLSNPFFIPGFNAFTPFHYEAEPKAKPRKLRHPSTPPPAR